jgi:hypothetical protein
MLKKLIEQEAEYSNAIHARVKAFLTALDKAGAYAPTITSVRGGCAYLGEIEVHGDDVVIEYKISYSGGDDDDHTLRVPVATVENPTEENITAYLAALAEKKRIADEAKAKKDIEDNKGRLWSPVQALKRLGVPLQDIQSQVEADYGWVKKS